MSLVEMGIFGLFCCPVAEIAAFVAVALPSAFLAALPLLIADHPAWVLLAQRRSGRQRLRPRPLALGAGTEPAIASTARPF